MPGVKGRINYPGRDVKTRRKGKKDMIRNYEGEYDGYILHTASGDGWETNLPILEALYNDIMSAELDPKDVNLLDWITGPIYATLKGAVVAEWNSRQGWKECRL